MDAAIAILRISAGLKLEDTGPIGKKRTK